MNKRFPILVGTVLILVGMMALACSAVPLLGMSAWRWGPWRLWPLEVLGVAGGFLLAAIYMRNLWLLIPVIIVGANGLLFQFCAITGWWGVWAVAWTIEPLSVGLALLAIVILSTIFSAGWLWGWIGPAMLIVAGALLLIMSLLHRPSVPSLAAE